MSCKNCGPGNPGGADQPSHAPSAPLPDAPGGPAGPTPGQRTRDFGATWDTSPSVAGPLGAMNDGNVHNVVSTNGQWARGEIPDLGYNYSFALRRPGLMREPGTNLGTVNLAQG
jgi:hypothetical protein